MSAIDEIAGYFSEYTSDKDTQRVAAKRILSVLSAAGYTVVPKEPTGKMQIAGGKAQQQCIGSWGEPAIVWKAMLAAAKESK